MRKTRIILALAAILSIQPVLANHQDASGKPCAIIADACQKAGFGRTETAHKNIWKGCMKPVILGKTVEGVTVDSAIIKSCRTSKVEKMKKELNEFQNAS